MRAFWRSRNTGTSRGPWGSATICRVVGSFHHILGVNSLFIVNGGQIVCRIIGTASGAVACILDTGRAVRGMVGGPVQGIGRRRGA